MFIGITFKKSLVTYLKKLIKRQFLLKGKLFKIILKNY